MSDVVDVALRVVVRVLGQISNEYLVLSVKCIFHYQFHISVHCHRRKMFKRNFVNSFLC